MSGLLWWLGMLAVVLGVVAGRLVWEELDHGSRIDLVAWSVTAQTAGTPASVQDRDATSAAGPAATPDCPAVPPPGRIVAVAFEVTIELTDQGFDPGTI